jgi:PAS domain S-box-containing protein
MNAHEPTDHRTGQSFMLIFGVLAAGIVTAALGFLALLGWVLGSPLLTGFGVDLMPMGPYAAVLFILFGAAICSRARSPLSRRAFWFSMAVGCLVALVALLLFTLDCLDIHWAVEHLGLNTSRTVRGAPTGYMSPVTALCFLLASVSFLASLLRPATRPWRAVLALGAAGALLGTCFMFLLAYFFGATLFYAGTFIPPALNTILAFTMLALALLALAKWRDSLLGRSSADGSRIVFAFVSIFVLLALGIVAAGYIYYQNYERNYRAEAERQLSAIADLKVHELTQYRNERLGDAAILFQNVSFSALVRRFLEKPEDADAQHQLQVWLSKYQVSYKYDRAFLIDTQGVTRMAVPGAPEPAAALVSQHVSKVLRSGQVVLQDFCRNEHNRHIYLALLIPIFDESDARRPLGLIVLRIDPAIYLYPFIQQWPVPSKTAETLLVRREGNEVVYLNNIRFQTDTALNFRAPLDRATLPAAQAALGREGVMEGIDYRGVPVVAALRTIPDSPWALVARVDTAEVYAPIRERLWQVVFMIGILIFGAGASVGLVWRQQRAEMTEALRESEVRYRRLFESAKDGILILDAETGMIVDVNPFLIEKLGYTREAFLAKKIWELGFFRNIVASQAGFKELQQKGYIRYENRPLETVGGRPIEVEFVSNVYLVDHQKVVQCNIRDITERKRAEEGLKESQARFKMVFDSAGDGMFVYDLESQKIAISNAACSRMLGFTPEEFRNLNIADLHLPEDLPSIFEKIKKLLNGEESVRQDIRFKRRDGSTFFADLNPALITLDSRKGALVAFRDITERRRAEEALWESEQKYRTLFEESRDAIYIASREGKCVEGNKAWLELFGYTKEELVDLRAQALWANPDERTGLHQEIERKGFVKGYEAKLRKKDGTEMDCTLTSSLWQATDGIVLGYQTIIHDITGRKRRDAERQLLLADLGAKNRELESFVYTISHDLKAPLVSLSGFSAALQKEICSQLSEEGKHYLERIQANVGHMDSLIGSLLELSRIGRVIGAIEEVDVAVLLREIWDELAVRLEKAGVEFQVWEPLPTVRADQGRMRQVFANLIDNAIKFRSAERTLRIEVGCQQEGSFYRFHVADNGIGIAPQYHEQIFAPFRSLHPEIEGAGMGLAIVKKIVEHHGGRVWVEGPSAWLSGGDEGMGATFYFTLPIECGIEPHKEES